MPPDNTLFLSTLPASKRDQRLALGLTGVTLAVFVGLIPFAKAQLAPVFAFIPVYETALVVIDAVTAVLLLSQYAIVGSRGLLLLACAYLFTALTACVHALTFPGLFSPSGLLAAGMQSTAWLYMFWHAGFPALVAAYALCRQKSHLAGQRLAPAVKAVALVLASVGGFTLLATAGHDLLPPIMTGNTYTATMIAVVATTWLMSALPLAALWRKKERTVLDMWLMAVSCVWLCDIGLSAVFNQGRFDLGFYAGRVYGLLASALLLVMLLIENTILYARLARAQDELIRTARHDGLTGLPNRVMFSDYLVKALARAERGDHDLALLFLDLDGFKAVNDTFGHLTGDELLKAVADRLLGCTRTGDLVSRLGGDEFTIVVEDCQAASLDTMAHKILATLKTPFDLGGQTARISASIGISMYPECGQDAGTLIEKADAAMYKVKKEGKEGHQYCQEPQPGQA